jgi:hypothetical protein
LADDACYLESIAGLFIVGARKTLRLSAASVLIPARFSARLGKLHRFAWITTPYSGLKSTAKSTWRPWSLMSDVAFKKSNMDTTCGYILSA